MLCEDVGMSMLFAVFLVSLQSVTSEGSFWSIIAIAGYTAERTVAEGGLSFFVDSILLMRLQQFYSL